MPDGSLFVYKCARDAHEQITRLSDFVSPTIVAMWNLRQDVKAFLESHSDAKQKDIIDEFAVGSGVRGNEIKRACIDNSWEEQRSRFAAILLTNTIAIFEEFLECFVALTVSDEEKARKIVKALQYPVTTSGRNYRQGYQRIGNGVSELAGVFRSGTALGRWYSGPKLQNLLLCFRMFKEIRNANAHSGGKATIELMGAYAAFAPVATPADLGVKIVPKHSAPTLNKPIVLELEGVYAFSDVVLRLIATYDRDLSETPGALADIDARLGSISVLKRSRSYNSARKVKLISGLLIHAKLPNGTITPAFMKWLKRTNRVPASW